MIVARFPRLACTIIKDDNIDIDIALSVLVPIGIEMSLSNRNDNTPSTLFDWFPSSVLINDRVGADWKGVDYDVTDFKI
jgi:hypothetical protein